MPESLPGSTTALREELEAATATFEDEQAAHQETLSLLAAANARADDSARKLAAMEKYHEFAVTQSQEALAAARRECDLLRDTLTLIAGFPCSGNSYEPVRLARKALAAPASAAGEEGT